MMEIIGKNLLSTMRKVQRLLQSNDQADQISASQNKVVNIKFSSFIEHLLFHRKCEQIQVVQI